MSFSSTDSGDLPEILIRRHSPNHPWTYSLLDSFQRKVAERVRTGGPCARGALILSEVAPVITIGRRTSPSDILISRADLEQKGIQVIETDRGGLATYHGPGQWILFAVDHLERLTGDSRGVRKAVDSLLQVALTVGHQFDPSAQIREGAETGVWTSRGKFASVGVHIQDRVLLHGLSVNAYRTPLSFTGIRPCGLDSQVDFLLKGLSGANEMERAFLGMGEDLRNAALWILWSQRAP